MIIEKYSTYIIYASNWIVALFRRTWASSCKLFRTCSILQENSQEIPIIWIKDDGYTNANMRMKKHNKVYNNKQSCMQTCFESNLELSMCNKVHSKQIRKCRHFSCNKCKCYKVAVACQQYM